MGSEMCIRDRGVDALVNLNVQLISGQLGREVVVIFDTQSGTATSRQW